MSKLPQLSTASEAMDTLHVDPSTLQDLVTSGQLPAYNFGEEGTRYNVANYTPSTHETLDDDEYAQWKREHGLDVPLTREAYANEFSLYYYLPEIA